MAAVIADSVFDAALNFLETNGTRVDICSASPTNWAGLAAVTLGNKTGCTYTGPADHTSGRKTTLDEITDGDVTDSDTATHFCISNGSDTVYVIQELSSSEAVTSGAEFSLTACIIAIPDPTA